MTLVSGGFLISGSCPVKAATTLAGSLAKSGATGRRGGEGPQFYFIDVSLQGIADESERNSFQTVPTALTLDAATVDRLRAIARKQFLESADFKKLATDLGN